MLNAVQYSTFNLLYSFISPDSLSPHTELYATIPPLALCACPFWLAFWNLRSLWRTGALAYAGRAPLCTEREAAVSVCRGTRCIVRGRKKDHPAAQESAGVGHRAAAGTIAGRKSIGN